MNRRRKRPQQVQLRNQLIQLKTAAWVAWQPYVRRFAPMQIAVMMLTIFTLSITAGQMAHEFFPKDHALAGLFLQIAFGVVGLMSLSFFLVIRGYPRFAWALFVTLVLGLALALVVLLETQHRGVALVGLCIPLVGLYLMSTRRYQRGLRTLQVAARKRRRIQGLEAGLKHVR